MVVSAQERDRRTRHPFDRWLSTNPFLEEEHTPDTQLVHAKTHRCLVKQSGNAVILSFHLLPSLSRLLGRSCHIRHHHQWSAASYCYNFTLLSRACWIISSVNFSVIYKSIPLTWRPWSDIVRCVLNLQSILLQKKIRSHTATCLTDRPGFPTVSWRLNCDDGNSL